MSACCAATGMALQPYDQKKRMLHCSIALLACMMLSCPAPRRSVTIKIQNDSVGVTITALYIIIFGGLTELSQHVTDDLLSAAVGPGEADEVVVALSRVGDGDGFGVGLGGVQASEQFVPLNKLFEGGQIFNLTITGDVNSYSIEVVEE
ncbi:MAG: hypothetical protein SGI88_17700 [Candidatus Hydrogenedentes bacterium]|nr:hypothetical protein [Candidatus Hydrogenedentota bacterium]